MASLPHPALPERALPGTERLDLAALHETSRLLSASLDVPFILGNLLLTAMSKALTTRGVVLLRDDSADGFRVAAARGVSTVADGVLLIEGALDVGTGLVGEAVPEALAQHRLALVLPVRFGSRDVGLVALGGRVTGGDYSDDALNFLRSLVSMTAPALQNARSVEDLRDANRRLDAQLQRIETLFSLSKAFGGTADRPKIARLLALTLMGQTASSRHAFLATPPGETSGFVTLGAKGFKAEAFDPALVDRLCGLPDPFVPEPGDPLADMGAALVVPLKQGTQTCGLLVLGPKANRLPYGPDEVELVEAIGGLALTAVRNSFLLDEQVLKQRMEQEMRLARTIQERLLPQKLPRVEGADLAAVAIPSRDVGGDLYDAVVLGDGRLLLAVADVTGKGVPAALLMANMQACLHVLLPDPGPLDEVASRINRVICENTSADKFITAFLCVYEPATGALEYVNAGHNPPYLVRASGEVEELREGGLLLGVMKGLPYHVGTATLAPGDTLTMFTDGVSEALGPENEEFTEERLIPVLVAHRHASAQAQLEGVVAAVAAFTGPVIERSDDITCVVLRAV